MAYYDYKEGKKRINAILNSKTKIKELESIPKDESQFTYENGIKTFVGSLFVDIRDSSKYFKENNSEHIARIMRAFCSEIISILNENDSYRQIGIRGDCVYAIYSVPLKDDVKNILYVDSYKKLKSVDKTTNIAPINIERLYGKRIKEAIHHQIP